MLGVGVIGCGLMARELAAALHEAAPEAKLVAGYDPFAPSRAEFCARVGAKEAEALEQLLAREDVGAVLIASPNYLHKEHTLAAAAAGKHVFCEKPMALTVADCDEMLAAAERAGVKLMVGHSTRVMPPMMSASVQITPPNPISFRNRSPRRRRESVTGRSASNARTSRCAVITESSSPLRSM